MLGSHRGRLQEWGYVALSRAREQTRLYVTGNLPEHESHFHELDERDPLTRLAQALEASGAERLATEQRPLPAGPRPGTRAVIVRRSPAERELERARSQLHRLEERQRETERLRLRAERRLAAAEESLTGLGWRARGGRRRELRGEIALQRSTLRLAEEKIAELERERRQTLARLSLAEKRALTRAGERSPRVRPEREPQLTLDLGL